MPATMKPDGQPWTIREQILKDLVTGLTFQFEVAPDGEMVFRIFGDSLPFGNREINFKDGEEVGSGTFTGGACRPSWLTLVE